MNKARGPMIGVLIVSVVALATFFVAGAVVKAEDKTTRQELHVNDTQMASSVEEASEIAGYSVKTPKWVPDGFVQESISVTQLRINSKGPETLPVQTEWVSKDGSRIIMIQLPGVRSFPIGESIEVAGVGGTRILYQAVSGRPPVVSLYWQVGDRSFGLGGTMTESLDQEALLEVAASIDYY